MAAPFAVVPGAKLQPAERLLKTALHSWNQPSHVNPQEPPAPFITISRQPGAGTEVFSHRLAERLSELDRAPWTAWDRELLERVSAETEIARSVLEAIEERPHTWLDHFLENISMSQTLPPLELKAYKKIMVTIRALASSGYAIIVGRGGTFITAGMPGGIHLRLVAPLEHRIQYVAERDRITPSQAVGSIAFSEQNRTAFYRRYWPGKAISPESFSLTLNAGELSVEEMVDCVVPLVRRRQLLGAQSLTSVVGAGA
ncbi:MAG TPA: cytidylate kinase-like family protein [Tepidisphaeraceae bacterium]|nr:cytidylate kinase-like family protein [Tepidisphaeraceae bacterium]